MAYKMPKRKHKRGTMSFSTELSGYSGPEVSGNPDDYDDRMICSAWNELNCGQLDTVFHAAHAVCDADKETALRKFLLMCRKKKASILTATLDEKQYDCWKDLLDYYGFRTIAEYHSLKYMCNLYTVFLQRAGGHIARKTKAAA